MLDNNNNNNNNMEIKCSKNKAFTLAEVLLTLTIIGVIAAETIPSVLLQQENQKYKVLAKRSHALLSQAWFNIVNIDKYDVTHLVSINTHDPDNPNTAINFYIPTHFLVEQFKDAKKCYNSMDQGCYPSKLTTQVSGTLTGGLNDEPGFWDRSSGMSCMLTNIYNSCTGSAEGMGNACFRLMVDTDGPTKGPTRLCKDILVFYGLADGKIVPAGLSVDTNSGYYCTARMVRGEDVY